MPDRPPWYWRSIYSTTPRRWLRVVLKGRLLLLVMHGTQHAVPVHAISESAPGHPCRTVAPEENEEQRNIPYRQQPQPAMGVAQRLIRPERQPEARQQRDRSEWPRPGCGARQYDGQHGERERMHQRRAEMAGWVDGAGRAAPAHFVRDQPRGTRFYAGMGNGERWNRNALAGHAHGLANRMVLGEVMGKLLETADFLQRSAAHCDGRSHTWFRETQCQAGHHAGKTLIVDRSDSQTWPEPRG